ncbi:hypothetical protein [Alteromonas sp. ASW11-130]|nr:hypothetical protein [Alteromonas sp. ASW11-130]MCW8092650.1 hypothetical protein [Alteromonas sp. ASW11-130]
MPDWRASKAMRLVKRAPGDGLPLVIQDNQEKQTNVIIHVR